MMGATDILRSALGDLPESADITEVNHLAARALVRAGLAVVIIRPLSKQPACILSADQAKQADLEAKHRAREAGNPNWERARHDCGVSHAITDPRDLNRARVKAFLAHGANLAIALGRGTTRMIAVDLDTAEQVRAFRADWRAATGEELTEPLTVTSPGQLRATVGGEQIWVHKGGGHMWFTVPDDAQLPEHPGKYTAPSGWVAMYGSGYVLVPPSVRPEGRYRLTGPVLEAPSWLLEAIRAGAAQQATRERPERDQTIPTEIDQWAAATPWAKLLRAAGWQPTGEIDTCGCPTWTRPADPIHGPAANLKSATAHDPGCGLYDTTLGHGPLHVWTDAVDFGGQRTVTKLGFVAWTWHGGDTTAAMRALGITPKVPLPPPDELGPFDPGPGAAAAGTSPANGTSPQGQRTLAELEAAIVRTWNVLQEVKQRTRRAYPETREERALAELDKLRAREDARTMWLQEQLAERNLDQFLVDGDDLDILDVPPLISGVLPRESYALLTGRDGAMKTFIALDWALSVATAQPWHNTPVHPIPDRPRVLFMVGEGQLGFRKRVRAWKAAHQVDTLDGNFTALFRRINFFADPAGVDWLCQTVRDGGYGLVVIDHLRLISGGADGNSSDMGVVVDRIKDLVEATVGGSVLVIAHTDKTDTDTRGYSGIEDDADTIWHAKRVTDDDDRLIGVQLTNTKAKDSAEHTGLILAPRVVELGTSAVGEPITSLVLEPSDPLGGAQGSREEQILALIRTSYSAIGVTQSEIRDVLGLPKSTCSRMINALVERGLLEVRGRRYFLGPAASARGESGE